MANFELMTKVGLSEEDMNGLVRVRKLLDDITDEMDTVSEQYFIESLETGEIIEYDELLTALMIIERLVDEKTGRNWKLV